jgi:hypothetical protein
LDPAELLKAIAFAADKHRHQRRKDAEASPNVLDDPICPRAHTPGKAMALPEDAPKMEESGDGTRQGKSDFRRIGYGGPCPPVGKPHRYFLRCTLSMPSST